MSNARFALGALFSTAAATANTVTSTMDAVNDGIGMLNSTVKQAKFKQDLRHVADKESFADQLIRDMSRQEAEADIKELDFIKKSTEHKEAYEKHFNKYSALLKPNPATP